MMSHRNEKHWLTEEEREIGTWGESLEGEVAEIKSVLLTLESAFSGIQFAAAAIRAKELGFDRRTVFWPYAKNMCFGMAWKDDPELVAGIEPPGDLSPGWKLDPHYGDRVRYWNGEQWDRVAAPAPGNLDLYKRIAAGENVEEVPEGVRIHPVNSHEPNPIWQTRKATSDEESDNDDEPEPEARS